MSEITDIVVILDSSGSMNSVRQATIAGLNQFIAAQQQLPDSARLRVVAFSSGVRNGQMPYQNLINGDLADAKPISPADYAPSGGTPLFDAIGKTLIELAAAQASGSRIGQYDEPASNALGRKIILEDDPEVEQIQKAKPPKTIVTIITDGEENASRMYTRSQINTMIERGKQKMGWEFIFMGANQDAMKEGASLGVSVNASVDFLQNEAGMRSMYAAVSRKSMEYRTGLRGMMSFDAEERADLAKGEWKSAEDPDKDQKLSWAVKKPRSG